jgi:hypothetical protein
MRDMKWVLMGTMLLVLLGFGFPSQGLTRVSLDIQVNPPPLIIEGPPEMVVIPGTYVYFSPDVQGDLLFYGGYWYRPYEGRWFRSANYRGPWVYIGRADVPRVFFELPRDYRAMSGYRRIPYRDLSRNWRTWEREKYWERHGWGRQEREHGAAPSFREREGERHHFDNEWDHRERERH